MDSIAIMKKSMRPEKILDQKVLNELHPKALAGDKEAMTKIVDSLLGFVVDTVTKIHRKLKVRRIPIELEDLVQEGFIGLLAGIRKFEPDRGYKMTTYCYYWIFQKCWRFIYNNNLIRVPLHLLARKNMEHLRCGPVFNPTFDLDHCFWVEEKETEVEGVSELEVLDAKTLSDRQKRIVIERFFEGRFLREVGDDLKLSRQRIQQIEKQ